MEAGTGRNVFRRQSNVGLAVKQSVNILAARGLIAVKYSSCNKKTITFIELDPFLGCARSLAM